LAVELGNKTLKFAFGGDDVPPDIPHASSTSLPVPGPAG
jgi:hypothetical protein